MSKLKQHGYNKGGLGMMPLITIALMTMSLMFFAGQQATVEEYGGKTAMNRTAGTMNKNAPLIDSKALGAIKTATFAMG
jgi:hypothetical protein